jgi:hypothetical protein
MVKIQIKSKEKWKNEKGRKVRFEQPWKVQGRRSETELSLCEDC